MVLLLRAALFAPWYAGAVIAAAGALEGMVILTEEKHPAPRVSGLGQIRPIPVRPTSQGSSTAVSGCPFSDRGVHSLALPFSGEQGPSGEIFRHLRHPYTRALLSANPSHDPAVVADRLQLSGEIPSPSNRPPGCEFHTRCPFVTDACRSAVPGESPGRPWLCACSRKERPL